MKKNLQSFEYCSKKEVWLSEKGFLSYVFEVFFNEQERCDLWVMTLSCISHQTLSHCYS
jgi:hypothetical protein